MEIALLVELGGVIGLDWTILCIFVSTILGLGLLRRLAIDNFRSMQETLQIGEFPLFEMLERIAIKLDPFHILNS